VIFSACGWTNEARAEAERLVADAGRRRRWHPAGIKLLELEEVDADLRRWSV